MVPKRLQKRQDSAGCTALLPKTVARCCSTAAGECSMCLSIVDLICNHDEQYSCDSQQVSDSSQCQACLVGPVLQVVHVRYERNMSLLFMLAILSGVKVRKPVTYISIYSDQHTQHIITVHARQYQASRQRRGPLSEAYFQHESTNPGACADHGLSD